MIEIQPELFTYSLYSNFRLNRCFPAVISSHGVGVYKGNCNQSLVINTVGSGV